MRERWCGAMGARSPGPQHERVALHVLDNLLSAPTATVPSWVLHFLTDLRLGQPLPLHRQGCQVPARDARNETVGCVRRLVACLTLLGGRAVAILPTDHEWLMKDGSIRLPWRIVLVAVQASRVTTLPLSSTRNACASLRKSGTPSVSARAPGSIAARSSARTICVASIPSA